MGLKYNVDEEFFKRWNPTMAYVLGYWYADGHLQESARGKYITVTSVEKENLWKIGQWMKSGHTIRERSSSVPGGKDVYYLRIGNRFLYDDLVKRGLYPKKSLTIVMPAVPIRYANHFVRGYFDGDGCAHLEMGNGVSGQRIIKRLRVTFTSGSKKFLEGLQVMICEQTKSEGKIYRSSKAFQLVYGTNESIPIFRFLYEKLPCGVLLERKLEVFLRYFGMRKKIVDNKTRNVINYVNRGHVVK